MVCRQQGQGNPEGPSEFAQLAVTAKLLVLTESPLISQQVGAMLRLPKAVSARAAARAVGDNPDTKQRPRRASGNHLSCGERTKGSGSMQSGSFV